MKLSIPPHGKVVTFHSLWYHLFRPVEIEVVLPAFQWSNLVVVDKRLIIYYGLNLVAPGTWHLLPKNLQEHCSCWLVMSSFEEINIEKNPPVRMMMVAREMCLLLMQWLWMVWPFSIKHKETFDHFFLRGSCWFLCKILGSSQTIEPGALDL